jgi:hypothetical protein
MPTVWWAFTVLNKREAGNNSSEVSILAALCGECIKVHWVNPNSIEDDRKLEGSIGTDHRCLPVLQSSG